MATITYDNVPYISQVRTTNNTATDVPMLSWTALDKEIEVYEIEAFAVRENVANPAAGYIRRIVAVTFSGGSPIFIGSSDGAGGEVKHYDPAAGAIACTMVAAAANVVKVQVTGLAASTLNWLVKVTRHVLASNP